MNRLNRYCLYGTLLFVGVMFGSCNRQTAKTGSNEDPVIYPPPPDSTRIQFLTHFSSSEDLEGKKGGFYRYLFGEAEPASIVKPYGVTVQGSKVYICDTGLGGLVIMDLSKRSFEQFIPGGKGLLQLPINCDLDDSGYLYVADANRKQIVVFDGERKYLHAFGETEAFKPTDVEVSHGKIWVANVQDHSVYVYDMESFELLEKIPDIGSMEQGFIRQSTNICLTDGLLYVSDFGDFNIKRYTLAGGGYEGTIGSYGDSPGCFTRPKGIALDRGGNLYVVDAAFENVQIFNKDGDLLMHFGGSYEGRGAMWLPAAVEVSYENLSYFQPYVDDSFNLKYVIFVTNQYGPAKINVYGFVEDKLAAR